MRGLAALCVWQMCTIRTPLFVFHTAPLREYKTSIHSANSAHSSRTCFSSHSFCKSVAALLTWPRSILQLFPGGIEEPATCSVFEQHCTHPKIPEISCSVHRLLVSEKGTGFQYLWGCALEIGHFTELPALWAEKSFNHLLSKWHHCRERPGRPGLGDVAWKDNREWHLTRPSSLRLPLDAHLSLHHYFRLENASLLEANVDLPLLLPFMLARETQLIWEDI